MKPFDRLLLLDPELGNPGGHYDSFAASMQRACDRKELTCIALGGPGAEIPVFDGITRNYVPRWMGGALINPFVGGVRTRRQLQRAATTLTAASTLVLAATANHRHYGALSDWLLGLPDEAAPALAVLLRYPEYDARREAWRPTTPLTRRGLSKLEAAARRRRVRLLTDSDGLAAEYRQLTGLPVAALPIPHMMQEAPPARPRGTRMRFGFLGEARHEKGFGLVVEAIERLDQSGLAGNLELVIQNYVREGFEPQSAADSQSRLAACRLPNLRVLNGCLDAAQFEEEMLSCDTMLLPYTAERYRSRNSGIFADSVAAGISVIVTRGTWMAEQLTQGSGAGLMIPDADVSALANAMVEIAARRDEMRAKAAAAAEAWRATHDPLNFLDGLLRLFP